MGVPRHDQLCGKYAGAAMNNTPENRGSFPADRHSRLRQHRFAIISYLAVTLTMAGFMILENTLASGVLLRDAGKYLLYVYEALNNSFAAAAEAYPGMPGYPPMLVMLMFAAGKVGIDPESAGRFLNSMSMIFSAWAMLYCCRRLYKDQLAALCTALMLISLPKLYLTGCNIMRDPLYWAESLWALALLLNLAGSRELPLKKYFWNLLGMALLLATACLTRKEGIFLTMLFTLWNVTLNPAPWRRKLWSTALILAIAALAVTLPFMLNVPWDISELFTISAESEP